MGMIIRPKTDGHNAPLFVLYLANTSEDPCNCGHEGFLDEILPIAREQIYFNSAGHSRLRPEYFSNFPPHPGKSVGDSGIDLERSDRILLTRSETLL